MQYKQKLALIIAFYLSKFDRDAVEKLGFKNFSSAFRDIGNILEVKSNSLKQMREQFDPYHDNTRVGWYQRPLSRSRRDVMNQYGGMSEAALRVIVQDILTTAGKDELVNENYTKYIVEDENNVREETTAYTTRGATGKAAEDLFKELYDLGEINGYTTPLKDTRVNGTGYDFEMIGEPEYVFEVKGLRAASGSVLFTDHEWKVAQNLGDKYFVVLLYNLDDEMQISIVQNPFNHLNPKMQIHATTQITWHVGTGEIINT